MTVLADGHVLCVATVLWDGITKPEPDPTGAMVHSLRVALPPGSPEIAELKRLATTKLNESDYKGQLPQGGRWPFKLLAAGDIDPSVEGYTAVNPKTRLGVPTVCDINGLPLSPTVFNSMLYPGAKVRVLINAYVYTKAGGGVGFNLGGIQIVDATVPKLNIAGGIDATKAFASAPMVSAPAGTSLPIAPPATAPSLAPPVAPPVATAPVQPHHDFVNGPGGPGAPAPAPAAPVVPPAAPGYIMTAKAQYTYAEYIAAKWTDQQLIDQGLMQLSDVPQ